MCVEAFFSSFFSLLFISFSPLCLQFSLKTFDCVHKKIEFHLFYCSAVATAWCAFQNLNISTKESLTNDELCIGMEKKNLFEAEKKKKKKNFFYITLIYMLAEKAIVCFPPHNIIYPFLTAKCWLVWISKKKNV